MSERRGCTVNDLKALLEEKLSSSLSPEKVIDTKKEDCDSNGYGINDSHTHRLVLDIDETLAATNVAWFERMVILFGNQEGLTVSELIDKYHLAQYNPTWKNNPAAMAWMNKQRTAPEAQDGLPIIPGAVEGVKELMDTIPDIRIVGYLTVRPVTVETNTIRWLRESGFPELPVVSKPVDVPFEEGNQWKAAALHKLWPEVTGIIDDNPKVPTHAGSEYPGQIYLFGRDSVAPGHEWAIPCKTWPDVVDTIRKKQKTMRSDTSEG